MYRKKKTIDIFKCNILPVFTKGSFVKTIFSTYIQYIVEKRCSNFRNNRFGFYFFRGGRLDSIETLNTSSDTGDPTVKTYAWFAWKELLMGMAQWYCIDTVLERRKRDTPRSVSFHRGNPFEYMNFHPLHNFFLFFFLRGVKNARNSIVADENECNKSFFQRRRYST